MYCLITVKKITTYPDLIAEYELPLDIPCFLKEGMTFISNGNKPDNFCDSAWDTIAPFVTGLLNGKKNFYGNWMKKSDSVMISCNDGFRPVSFLIELKK